MKDPFSVLGLRHGASEEDVKKAYRRLAKRYHPDVTGGDAEKERRMSEINDAYEEILGNPEAWLAPDGAAAAREKAATLRKKASEHRSKAASQVKAKEEAEVKQERKEGRKSFIGKALWLLLWIAITLLACFLVSLLIRGVKALAATEGFKSFKASLPSEETTMNFLEKLLRSIGSVLGAFFSFIKSIVQGILG